MLSRKQTPKAQFKPSVMKLDMDNIRSQLPPALRRMPNSSSSRYEKSKPSINDPFFNSTATTFPAGITQNLSNTYRAKTRQGFDFVKQRGSEINTYESENFLAHQDPVTSLMKHHQKYRSFLPNTFEVKKEKVPLSKFTFDLKPDDLSVNMIKFESMMENKLSNRVSSGSVSTRPFVQTSVRISTQETAESDYGMPFKEAIMMKRAKSPQKPLENINESHLEKRRVLKTEESFNSNNFSGIDIADLDSKIAKTFRLKKDISTKYKSDIHSKEIEKKFSTVKKLTNEELILLNKDKLLVCVDNGEVITEQLQYCFVTRTIIRGSATKISKVGIEFNIKLDEIVRKLKLPSSYKYLYLLNGTPVFELSQIPSTENVLILSQQIELNDVGDIIQDDLVRDFYEYGTNKDIKIYSKSHIRSRLDSIVQAQHMVEEKYNDVLRLFDNGEQLDSAQLEKILETEEKQRNKEFSGTVNNFYTSRGSKMFKNEKLDTSKQSKRFNTMGESRTENLHTEEDAEEKSPKSPFDRADTEEPEEKNKIKEYIRDKNHLSENKKFDLYQDINNYYNGALKKIRIQSQETEDGNDFEANERERAQGEARMPGIGDNLEVLLDKWKSPRKRIDYLDIKKVITATTKKDMTSHSKSRLQDELVINQYDNLIDAPTLREKNLARNFIIENKKSSQKKKSDINKLSKLNRELFLKNIPKNLEEKKLSRRELHYTYILYKALCEVTSQRHKEYKMGDGIDYHCFKNGINQVFLQSDEVAEKIFYSIDLNFSGFLNWEEFISAMVVIRAKTMRDKIDLFIKIADEDGNGSLSKEEIFKLAKICLKKFVTGGDETFLDSLCEYFTKLIFSSVDIDMEEEIPLQSIKQAIISGNAESDLLAMFCGADI